MQRGRCHQEHRVDARVGEQSRVVAVQPRHAERARCRELVVDRTAGGDELGARYALREVLGVPAAEAPESDDADPELRRAI